MANQSDSPEVREQRKLTFIETYARVGEIQPACDAADISRPTYRRWREEDEDFGAACGDAKAAATDAAVTELRRRGVEGVEELILYKGEPVWKRDPTTGLVLLDDNFNPVPFTRLMRSDRLLETYVKAHRQEYRDKGTLALTGADGGPMQTKLRIEFVAARDGRPAGEDEPDPLET